MPYRAPSTDAFDHKVSMKRNLRLPAACSPLLDELAEKARQKAGKSNRNDVLQSIRNALDAILANLHLRHRQDENRYVVISSGNDSYQSGPYNPLRLSGASVGYALSFLIEKGPRYLEVRGGNFDHNLNKGYARRFRAGPQLIEDIEDMLVGSSLSGEHTPITRKTLEDANSPIFPLLFQQIPIPSVRLRAPKSDGGAYLSFDDTPHTKAIQSNLDQINGYIADHWIDLLIPDADLHRLARSRDDESENGDFEQERQGISLATDRSLYRVFNNGNFDEGGRFYGGWWQSVPKAYRKHITINWFPTIERDFSNMQIAMLYAREGMRLEDDAYSIDGVDRTYRPLIKRLMLQLINAKDRFRRPLKEELPPDWSSDRLIAALQEKHRPIADYFNSGIGIHLQRQDADIAEEVMLSLRAEKILALPIHDSFIVKEGHQDRLVATMMSAYRNRFQAAIGIDADVSWFDELPQDAHELHELDVYNYEDQVAEVEQRKGFEQYRKRKSDFVALKGDDWGYSRSWLS